MKRNRKILNRQVNQVLQVAQGKAHILKIMMAKVQGTEILLQ